MLHAIWASNEENIIGDGNELLWHLPEDLKFFKQKTSNSTVIMGRKTWDSLPSKPLPNRSNIVLTQHPDQFPKSLNLSENGNVQVITDFGEFLNTMDTRRPVWVIGGAQLYGIALPYCASVVRTVVRKPLSTPERAGSLVYAPTLEGTDFRLVDDTGWLVSDSEGLQYKHQLWLTINL